MLRLTALILLVINFSLRGTAQSSKFSASLKLFLASEVKDSRFIETKNGIPYVPLFLELTEGATNRASLQKAGIALRTVAGSVATADVPLADLERLAMLPAIKRLELPQLLHRHNDSLMKKFTTVDKVLAGKAPLSMPYTGQGVVIGIIDDGIEFSHPDFLDSAGRTTIHAIWNMDYPGNPPAGFSYGTVWERDTLNYFLGKDPTRTAGLSMKQLFGNAFHGTSVAALAGGKKGVAPQATLIGVALTATIDTLLRSDRVVDGISFIYNQAKLLNKKCIINISLGTQWGGPHDGKTLLERAIDNICDEKPDLLVCTSVGNDGNNWKHWGGFPIHADSSFGFARYSYSGALYFTIPKEYRSSLKVSATDSRLRDINAPAISRDSILYQSPFLGIDSILRSPTPLVFNSYLKNGAPSASICFTASPYNDTYDELIISFKEFTSNQNALFDNHVSRFIFKGSGVVHGWFPFSNLHPLYIQNRNPYPDDPTYRNTDNDFSSAIPTNAYSVLSSGGYNIRECYINNLQNKVVTAYPSCQLTYFTSRGPTLDGRIKPDVLSPGENVLSANSRWEGFYGHDFNVDSAYLMFSGTSASSPITAGIAALIWQRFPAYSRDSIIHRIKSTTYTDAHTTALFNSVPNNVAGWGKADAFRALTGEATDLTAACLERMRCQTVAPPPPPVPLPAANGEIIIYPNPANGSVFIRYQSETSFQLSVFNVLGQLVYRTSLVPTSAITHMKLPFNHLAKGIYFIRCIGNGNEYTQAILISK